MSDARHVLEARDLHFAYEPQTPVLRGVGLIARAGQLLCVLGPNGSGKTTLLRCLLNHLRCRDGTIMLDGKALRKYSTRELARLLAYVPQVPSVSQAFSVSEIVLTGRFAHTNPLGLPGEKDLAVAKQAMIMTDTLRLADRMLDELSGGEAQCAMIARALAQQPQVMLLDEPSSHLDVKNQLVIYRMMQRLAHDWNMAVVCVSHDVNLAARFSDVMMLMRQGQVVAAGPPANVIRRDVLAEVYDVEIDLVESPDSPVPLIRAR